MKYKAEEIASLVGGRIVGKSGVVIEGVAGLAEATAQDLSFLRDAKNVGALKALESTAAGAILVPEGVAPNGKTYIQVKNPLAAFALILGKIAEEKKGFRHSGKHPTAVVASSVKIGKNVWIGPACVVEEDAVIGDNVTLVAQVYIGRHSVIGDDSYFYPQSVVREEVKVGKRCLIHSGTVIGADGYGFYFEGGKHNKIPQIGTVVIEDDVEIGACTTIDRATTGQTIIRQGTKIDNLVQVAHNVDVGPHALLCAQAGIAGSSSVGAGTVLAGQVGVADHVKIGDRVQIGAQSGVKEDAEAGSVLFGSPAQPIQETLRQTLLIRRLPDLFKDVKALKEKLEKNG